MKTLFFIIFLMLASLCAQAQSISYIETTKAWHYVYDQNGKKIRTISTSQGQIVAYSSLLATLSPAEMEVGSTLGIRTVRKSIPERLIEWMQSLYNYPYAFDF